jgi:hypothetical protein
MSKKKSTAAASLKLDVLAMKRVLEELVADIDAIGGVKESNGRIVLADDDETTTWFDLAETYLHACKALGVEPKIDKEEGA